MALEEVLGDVGAQVSGLVPSHLVIVNVDGTKLLENIHLVLDWGQSTQVM